MSEDVRRATPEFKPVYDRLAVDSRGHVWRGNPPEDVAGDRLWQVLDSAGELVGEFVLPKDLALQVITADHAYGVRRTASGERVVV